MAGRVEVIAGGMFCGKTEELLRRIKRAIYGRKDVVLVKPAQDNRYDESKVVSHSGMSFDAVPVKSSADILTLVAPYGAGTVVGIDEAQFFDAGIVDVVRALAVADKRVILAGLDLDSAGRPFGPMPLLMAEAELVTKVYAVCMVCGADATRSQRTVDSADVILVGGASQYEARCRSHWSPRPMQPTPKTNPYQGGDTLTAFLDSE